MKLLAGGDFHGDHDVWRWFLGEARRLGVDLIVLAGDILGFADEVEDPEEDQRIDAARVREALLGQEIPVLYIMGNDDMFELEPEGDRLVSLHDRPVERAGWNFVGYPYSLPWMGGVFEKPEEEIRADLEVLDGRLDSRTVLVTHSPAWGKRDPGAGPHKIGSRSLRDLIDQHPIRAHIHGHSHSGFGRDGIHFNVASARRKRAIWIDLETLDHEVVAV